MHESGKERSQTVLPRVGVVRFELAARRQLQLASYSQPVRTLYKRNLSRKHGEVSVGDVSEVG